VGGISSQQLRYIEILLLAPWHIGLSETNGYPFTSAKQVQVADPVSFLTQKILIQDARDRKDRAKDILYIHHTIEAFSGNLAELKELFAKEIRPKLLQPNWFDFLNRAGSGQTEPFGCEVENTRS